ncbi:MAG: hypothetical protein HY675_09430 [Chloroflexi bacterium]|nr:hypothetical protein [Chloroflexota bacterium]
MELKEYWQILVDRRWIVVGLTLLALLASVAVSFGLATSYKATVRLAIKPQSDQQRSDKFYSYDEYYAYVASEYLIDDIIELVESEAFRKDLKKLLEGQVSDIPERAIQAKKTHRVLIVNATLGSENEALLLVKTIGELLTGENKYFSLLSWQNPTVTIVDQPQVTVPSESRRALELGLRAALGLFAGIGLAFLLEYVAGSVRSAGQVERSLALPVLGEIPREAARLPRK